MATTHLEPLTPKTCPPDSELVKGWKQLETDATLAEIQLVSADFPAAVSTAMALLRRTLYVPRSMSFETRAAFVALQALYELDRLAEARDLLMEHYGELAQLEPEVLFLWVSLAIDTKECAAAAAMLKTYLHSTAVTDTTPQQYAPRTPTKAQSTPCHLTKAQYAAGAQLYAIEALAKGLGRMAEAEQWIMQDSEPLGKSEKTELLRKLAELTPNSSALPTTQSERKPRGGAADSFKPGAKFEEAQRPLQQPCQVGKLSYDISSEIQPAEDQPLRHGNETAPASSSISRSAHEQAGPSDTSSWVSATCCGLASKAHDMWHCQVFQLGSTEVSAGQLCSAAAVTGLFTIAAVAERKAIMRIATKSANRLQRGIMDAGMAAFNFTPNPMTLRNAAYN
ncbi:hypothetical protein ABBQ32_004500 [Trebouxia sp. C0010 RCD-2024]